MIVKIGDKTFDDVIAAHVRPDNHSLFAISRLFNGDSNSLLQLGDIDNFLVEVIVDNHKLIEISNCSFVENYPVVTFHKDRNFAVELLILSGNIKWMLDGVSA